MTKPSMQLWQVKKARNRARAGESIKLISDSYGLPYNVVWCAVVGQTWSSIHSPKPLARGEIRRIRRRSKLCINCCEPFGDHGKRCPRCSSYYHRNDQERPHKIDRRRKAKLTEEELLALYKRYDAGESLATVSKDLPFSEETLARRFKAAGYPIRNHAGMIQALTAPVVLRARALVHCDGFKVSKVSSLLGVNYNTLYSAVNGQTWAHLNNLPADKRRKFPADSVVTEPNVEGNQSKRQCPECGTMLWTDGKRYWCNYFSRRVACGFGLETAVYLKDLMESG